MQYFPFFSFYFSLDTSPPTSCLSHSTGLQVILPGYLQSRFIQAALNYIGCKSEGQFVCRNGDCWCECSGDFPQCNCPHTDLHTLENNLLRIRDTWRQTNQEFEESGESEMFRKLKPDRWKISFLSCSQNCGF